MSYDLYSGWIVAWVDGTWRACRVATGFAAVADNKKPNQHIGVFRTEDVSSGAHDAQGWLLNKCPHLIVGPEVDDHDVLDRIAFVRFGRTVRVGPLLTGIYDGAPNERLFVKYAIDRDLDDSQGLDPEWPRHKLPEMPKQWVRSARSLAQS